MPYLVGIDIGTSGTKTILIDETGDVLARATLEYPLYSPRPLWSEQLFGSANHQAWLGRFRALPDEGVCQHQQRGHRSIEYRWPDATVLIGKRVLAGLQIGVEPPGQAHDQ